MTEADYVSLYAPVRAALGNLDALLADPQPGLFTWQSAVNNRRHSLLNLLSNDVTTAQVKDCGCIDGCGCPPPDAEPTGTPISQPMATIISLLREIRDNQRTQAQAPALQPAEVGPDVVREIANELNAAANALDESAKQLKEDGKGWRAGFARQAASRARQVADGLTG